MISNALLLALTLFMAFGFLLMDRLKFLVPYRQVIFRDYGWQSACMRLFFSRICSQPSFCLLGDFFSNTPGRSSCT
jgi:hypothetical protein